MITVEKLRQIERAEALLKKAGFPINRVRHYGEKARIEVAGESIQDLSERQTELTIAIQALGFAEVEFDPEGFVSGKLNRAILSN